MKKSVLLSILIILNHTAHAVEWKNICPYVIGIPIGLASSSLSMWSNASAKKTFLKNSGKLTIDAFNLFNTSFCILSAIFTAWYIAKKTNEHEDCNTQQHIAEKTVDITGLAAILGLIGQQMRRVNGELWTRPNPGRKIYQNIVNKLPDVPPFELSDDYLNF